MLNSLIAQVSLVVVAAISAIAGVYSVIAARPTREAEAGKTTQETEQLGEQTWISRLQALREDLNKLQELSDERFQRLVEIEMLITEHVSWDFKMIRLLREHDIPVEDPPSLVYVRRKLEETKQREQEQQRRGGHDDRITE